MATDKVTHYQATIQAVMQAYCEAFPLDGTGLHHQQVMDPNGHHYQLLRLGWQGRKRVFRLIFHLDLIEDKIWIQEDRTEVGIANLLTERGIPHDRIVLAYFSPAHRRLTDFAVA
mgnify:CR=1 FL=1